MHAQFSEAAPQADRNRVLTQAALRTAEILGIRRDELASILGVSQATLSRYCAGKTLNAGSKAWELATLLIRLLRGLDSITGDDTASRSWLRSNNRDLRGVPIELMLTVDGLARTVAYVDAYRARV